MAMARSEDFKTPECRLSYAGGLFRPRAAADGAAERYSATLIFEKKYRADLEKHVAAVIEQEWGKKGIEKAKAGLIKSPFLAGDGKEARNKQTGELHPGMGPEFFFVRVQANKDRAPVVIWKDPNKQETEETVYSGSFGKAVLNCFAWHNPQSGDGVSFGIQMFQKLREGERLGGSGSVDPSRYYETVADEGAAPASTTSGAGAAGLFGE